MGWNNTVCSSAMTDSKVNLYSRYLGIVFRLQLL